MKRTCNRPLPSGQISVRHAVLLSSFMAVTGVVLLAWLSNPLASFLALLTILIYTMAYTPLKTRTTLNTIVGAVCGAIPPMIGWAGACGTLGPGAWVLGGVLFVWQIPHFLALAWLYREDYLAGGFAMLPVIDQSGRITGRIVVLTSLLLLPVALMMTLSGVTGVVAAAGSLVLGTGMVVLGYRLMRSRNKVEARRLFLGSVMYLPLLLCLMMLDRAPLNGPIFVQLAEASSATTGVIAAERPRD